MTNGKTQILWTSVIRRTPNTHSTPETFSGLNTPEEHLQRRRKIHRSIRRAKRFSFADGSGKISITILMLPGMAGETSDPISAYTQVETAEAPRLLELRDRDEE